MESTARVLLGTAAAQQSSLPSPNPIVSSAEYRNAILLRVGWTGTDSGLQRAQCLPSRECSGACGTAAVGLGRVPREGASEGSGSHSAHSARSRAECFARGFEWQTAVAHLEACQLWLRLRFALLRRPHSPARSRAERPAGWRAVSLLQIKLERRGVCNAMRCLSNRIASHSRGRRRKQNDADLSRNRLNPSGNDGTLKRATHTQTTQQSQNAPGIGALRRAIYDP